MVSLGEPLTSTAKAHGMKLPQVTGYEKITKRPKCPVALLSLYEDPIITENVKSEMKRSYVHRDEGGPSETNPSLQGRVDFMKGFVDTKMKFIKRTIIPPRSTSHNDYCGQTLQIVEPHPPENPRFIEPIKSTPILIDGAKGGYSKYLDPSGTTYKISYPHYTPSFIENSIARHDFLTFYKWKLIYKPILPVSAGGADESCNKDPKCNKHLEFPKEVRPVPNFGCLSESKAKFVDPANHPEHIEYHPPVKQTLLNMSYLYPPKGTEYGMIGSGERVLKYV